MKTGYILTLILTISVFVGFSACQTDNRPLDMQLKEALTDGLKEHQIKGASAAVILPDGSIHRIVAG